MRSLIVLIFIVVITIAIATQQFAVQSRLASLQQNQNGFCGDSEAARMADEACIVELQQGE